MDGETLALVDQRGGGCSRPRNIQGKAAQGFKQPGLWKVSLLASGELDWMTFKGLFQPKPLYDSTTVSLRGQNFHTKSGHENIPSIIHNSHGDLRVIDHVFRLICML